jgi:hypothetical protein
VTAVVELVVSASVEPWQRVGLAVHDGVAQIGGVRLRFDPAGSGVAGAGAGAGAGLVAWGLAGLASATEAIDGLVTYASEPTDDPPPVNALGAVGFDHIVVLTSSLERTCGEIERVTGEPLKRVREAGPVRQGFHRLGELIVEVVERASEHASFWGFVWTVTDIHEVCAALGPDIVSLPRSAVQPGRFIASFRESVGLCLPLAIMSPPAPRAHS